MTTPTPPATDLVALATAERRAAADSVRVFFEPRSVALVSASRRERIGLRAHPLLDGYPTLTPRVPCR